VGGTTVGSVEEGPTDEPVEEWTGPVGGPTDTTGGTPGGDEPVEEWAGPSPDEQDEWFLEDEIPDNEPSPPPDRFGRIRKSTAGVMMTGIAIGFQKALEPERQEPAFVIKASSDPQEPDGPIDLRFDPDDPTKTVAFIRSPTPEVAPTDPAGPTDPARPAGPVGPVGPNDPTGPAA